MLEGVVANLLNRFLGIYVKNFDATQLNIGIWSGDVKLRNLELRREALDQLRLPLNVVEGHLGELTLSIPWSNLRGKPVKVDIQDVFLLAAPREDADFDPEEEAKRENALKMERVESAEILRERNAEGMSQEEQRRNQSFTQSMITAVVDNLQISIKNVHFRYEDSIASPGHPFAVGVTLKELSAVSTDGEWNPTFIQSDSSVTHKLAVLGALSAYWNTDAKLLGTGRGSDIGAEAQGISRADLIEKLRTAIDADEGNQFMLRPVSGRAGLEMDKSGTYERPAIKARLLFDELGFVLDEKQYRDALMLVDLFHYFIRHQEHKKIQPKASPKEDPRAWMRFAGEAVLSKIHERNRRWTWDYIKERRDDRIAYIALFKKSKKEEAFTPEETKELQRLEAKLSYEDIRFWRSLARNQLRKENVGVKKPAEQQSWSAWLWGAKKEESEETAMTEEQRQELYNAIDWDEKKAITESVDVPREWVKLQVNWSLRAGSFTLIQDPHGSANEVMKLVFDNFRAKALQRHDSYLLDLDLGGLKMYDGTTAGTLYPQIVKVKDSPPESTKVEELSEDDDELASQTSADDLQDEDSLFHLQLEKNPLDSDADTAVKVKLKSIEVIYNPRFLVGIVKFFEPPERHMESIGALLDTAGATVEGLRQQTRAGLEFALQEHKKVDAQFDIHAPLIIVPESITQPSSLCLIIDAGHASVNSELVDRKAMREIQSKQKKQYAEDDYKQLEHLMYDRFLIKLDSTQVLIGPGVDATKAQLNTNVESRNFHIIDRINVDFALEMCIVPSVTQLTRTRISGHLPELHASISDTKYKGLMKLIDIAIPEFDTEKSASDSVTAAAKEEAALATRDRSSSFQPAVQRDLPVVDDDEDEVDSEHAKKRVDTPANIHRRDFEFKFTVGRLRGSLSRSDPHDPQRDQLLVELVAEGFELDFYMRPYDMVAEVILKSLSVDDHIEENPVPEFKRIISSKGFDADEDKDLFQLKMVRVKPESPEFDSTYEGVAMNLDISVSTINLVVTRKTLLTLLDFTLLTFTNPQQPTQPNPETDKAIEGTASVEEKPEQAGKIRIKANLKSIALILNNDGVRLATLSLNTADVGVFLVGSSMLIQSRIGSLTLVDDVNLGAAEDSDIRRLLTIEGDDFADFKYETFDPDSETHPGYDSEVYLRSGSIKINFLEEPYRKIIHFLVKFGKMQAIFNAARQAAASQANQLQENASRVRLDIIVKTPIVVFPRVMTDGRPRDTITAHLGEIYAKNEFVPMDDGKDSPAVNVISTGVRNIRLTSNFHFEDGTSEELEMIQKVNLEFSICYLEHQANNPRPDMEIEGSLSPINLRISQSQLKFLLELSKSIPNAFATDTEQQELEAMESLPSSVTEPTREASSKAVQAQNGSGGAPPDDENRETWVRLDMIFKVDSVGLELILANDDQPVGRLEDSSLSKFSLNDTRVKLRMLTDGSLESELLIHSFSIRDSRKQDSNKFRNIMSLINNDVQQQFMASVSMSGGPEKHLIAMLTIDSPRIMFALDYLSALQSFSQSAFASEGPIEVQDESESPEESESGSDTIVSSNKAITEASSGDATAAAMTVSFRVNLVDAQVIMVANPAIPHSEAIVLGTKEVLISHQNVSTLQIQKVGMFLCRMDKFETSRLRILDDFTLEMSIDSRSQDKGSALTSIEVHLEPLVLRLSLRDILMAIQIVNKASEMTQNAQQTESGEAKKITDTKTTRGRSSSKTSSAVVKRSNRPSQGAGNLDRTTAPQSSVVLKREEMSAKIDGVRVILIGDLHDLPLVDWSVKKFNIDVRDWSSTLNADTNFETFMNVYNFSKSAWEPLIEPWQLGFHMAKETNPDVFSFDVYSHKTMELTITSATIALASKSFQFLSTDQDVLAKPRGADAPYRIRNYTGFDLSVWADVSEGVEGPAAKLTDGEEAPWRFEDSTAIRESLTPEGHGGVVGVKLEGSGFDSISRIPVVREGEVIYALKPKQQSVLHRLLVEVKLGPDNVKYITFRSPLLIENNTQIPVEMGIFSPGEGHLLKIEKILPGDARPAPVGSAYLHSIVVRPDQGFGYDWSDERLFWKDLIKRPTRTVKCISENGQQAPPFYFQVNATFDSKDSLTSVYPYMRIRIFAPVEIQNLLPYDFKYRIYDKNTKKDWTNFLRKGGVSPVHVVELSHLLLLSIDLQDSVFRQSEFAIVNGNAQDYRREHTLTLKDERGLQLRLQLHYFNIPNSGGAFKVSVYSPYLVLNKTGLPMDIQSKAFLQSARNAAGQGLRADPRDEGRALPYMYSYANEDQSNRSILKVSDSAWSKPQSFEAIGSTFEVIFPDRQGRSEFHSGVSVAEGEGKYKMTKVVTLAPRFILKSKLNEDLLAREPGSSNVLQVKNGQLVPLHFLRQVQEKQLCLCFPGVNNQWSSPFNIADVGTVHVKLAKANQRQKLIKIDIIMEGATLFLHFSLEQRNWPFSMRNESDMEFIFYQANPNVEDDDEEDQTSGWRPIRYRIPARSIMPYAWDYPATKNKSLVLTCQGKERHIKLAEIGNLIPMRIPASQPGEHQKIIDINIAADGPTQTLVLSNFKPSKSMYKQQSRQSSQVGSTAGFEIKEMNSDVNFKAQLRLGGIGISLINQNLKELLYLTFREIEFKFRESRLYQTLNATIKWIQIDNQLYGGIFPILLYPSVVPKTGKEMEAHPIFHAMVTRVKDDSYGVLYIKYATLLLQQMTLELDEDFVLAMLDFVKIPGASWAEEQEGKLCDEDLNIPEPRQEDNGQDVYFELLHLQPMQMDISFMRTERVNVEDTMQPSNPLMFFVNVMTMSMGNVNDAPVRLNALMLENARVSFPSLVANIRAHYTQEFLGQIHIILGSADFLGNPVGLFNNVSSGVAAIFYEPYQGLVMTDRPQELGLGIAKGATSFMKKSIFGFSDSMAKLTGSMSKGLAAATLDKEFQNQRRMSKVRNRPKHALYGITAGGSAFATSLASGIGGLARHPLQGAEKEGIQGFFKGVGKGVLGLATKPAIGAFDLASNLAEGVRNTTTVFDAEGLDRVRLTRFIGTDGIVRPYSQREALGQFWLKTTDDGKYFDEDYIAHLELPGRDMLVLLTYARIMLVRTKKLYTEWDIRLTDIQTISKERTGMSITLKGGANGPFIPVQDESSRNWLYRQIAVAVNAFNEKYNSRG